MAIHNRSCLTRVRLETPEVFQKPRGIKEAANAFDVTPGWRITGPGQQVKLAAGWLIDRAGWKGHRRGACGVHDRRALVLVNHGGATGAEVWALALDIMADVESKYGVRLEPESIG